LTAAGRAWAADLLYFWFHRLGPGDWFGADDRVDDELRRRYARWLAALHLRPAAEFLADRQTARAAVLLFDQVPRNIHRRSARAFATDPLARAIAKVALARGWDRDLNVPERQFLAMPLMHSEDMADQRASLRYYAALGRLEILAFARSHHRMIARFGRFPHRNEVLGRSSVPAERAAVEAGSAW
jgi:uncharacterized protein (DUF924 family)